CLAPLYLSTSPLSTPASASPYISTLSLHDALPISGNTFDERRLARAVGPDQAKDLAPFDGERDPLDGPAVAVTFMQVLHFDYAQDRKSTRLNSSHVKTSYAVVGCKKKRRDHRDRHV